MESGGESTEVQGLIRPPPPPLLLRVEVVVVEDSGEIKGRKTLGTYHSEARLRKVSARPYPDSLPGVPMATLARLNGISERQARRLRARADPGESHSFLASLTPALAIALAEARAPGGHIPHWTRLAMAHHRQQGLNNSEIAKLLSVSLRSVGRVLGKQRLGGRGYNPLSGGRVRSSSQRRFVGGNRYQLPGN